MGTIHTEGSYRFTIPVDDHEPSHVHVVGDGAAKINITDLSVIWSVGFNKRDMQKIHKIVNANKDQFAKEWELIHG